MTRKTRKQVKTTFLTSKSHGEAYRRVLDAIALQRRNPDISLGAAARRSGTTLDAVRRHARKAVCRRGRWWVATAYDELLREMRFLTGRGYISLLTHDSEVATRIAEYHNAVRQFLIDGMTWSLDDFEGEYVEVDGQRYYFVTDPKTINRLARAGELNFNDIYASDGGL